MKPKDKFNELKEALEWLEKTPYGGEWDSALVGDSSGQYHAVTNADDVVVRTADDSRHTSWLCDYLESVSPSNIRVLLAELEAKDETLELEREKSRRVMSENHQQAERIAKLEGTRFITWPGNMFAPVLARIKVDVKRRDGSVSVGQSGGNVVWYHQGKPDDVVAFALTPEGDA
ncbi:hypothetical protein ACUNHR_24670 [Serratia sp. IR-2025]|uniref:hypothetical protein n=1 Tax=Serratia bockelmannii TaxID=2703793 RepID=UPI00313AEEEA